MVFTVILQITINLNEKLTCVDCVFLCLSVEYRINTVYSDVHNCLFKLSPSTPSVV